MHGAADDSDSDDAESARFGRKQTNENVAADRDAACRWCLTDVHAADSRFDAAVEEVEKDAEHKNDDVKLDRVDSVSSCMYPYDVCLERWHSIS